MMRTILYTFLLITCLLLTPCAFLHAGTDDSGLQVFTIDFSKQLGESADIAQEDTMLSPYCYNMFSDGNGLSTLSESQSKLYEYSGAATDIISAFEASSSTFIRVDTNLYYQNDPPAASSDTRVLMATGVSNYATSDMGCFATMNGYYVFVGNKIIKVTNNFSTTSEITLPASGTTVAVWQNRLFFASNNTIYYSAPQNFEDYTNTATTGGTTNIYECNSIYKLIGTKYGLYIFTDAGIFLQSGNGAKNSWSIERLGTITVSNRKWVVNFNDNIFFIPPYSSGLKLFAVNGANITEICEFFSVELLNLFLNNSSGLEIIDNGNMVVFFNSAVGGTSFVYNLKNKSFFRSGEFNRNGSPRYFIKLTSTGYYVYEFPKAQRINLSLNTTTGGYLKPLAPWAYQTSWMTLDGNASTRKEIDRVEFDYQGGTTSVYLYYAYGNGSSTYSSTMLTAPVNTRLSTYVWNAPIGKTQSNRFYLYFLSNGAQTMTTNYILKQARIYYRNIGNYKTNSLR